MGAGLTLSNCAIVVVGSATYSVLVANGGTITLNSSGGTWNTGAVADFSAAAILLKVN